MFSVSVMELWQSTPTHQFPARQMSWSWWTGQIDLTSCSSTQVRSAQHHDLCLCIALCKKRTARRGTQGRRGTTHGQAT